MQTVAEQFQQIQLQISEENKKTKRSLWVVIALYALLVPWVIWDTQNVMQQIEQFSAPENVADMAISQARAKLPQLEQDLTQHLDQSANIISQRIVESTFESLPKLESWAQQRLDKALDKMLVDFNQKNVPKMTAFIKANLEKQLPTLDLASSEAVNKAIVDATLTELDQELDNAINDAMLTSLLGIDAQLHLLLRKDNQELTLQQKAEKAAVLNAMFLIKKAQGKEESSLLAQGLRAILASLLPEDMFQALNKPI